MNVKVDQYSVLSAPMMVHNMRASTKMYVQREHPHIKNHTMVSSDIAFPDPWVITMQKYSKNTWNRSHSTIIKSSHSEGNIRNKNSHSVVCQPL